MYWNTSDIINDTNAVAYAETVGIPHIRKGSHVFIRCPEHKEKLGKEDNHFGNCILNEKGYYCFSCKAKGNVIDLDMHNFNHDFQEACTEITNWLGNPDIYQNADKDSKYHNSFHFPFTDEELDIINLHNKAIVSYPVQASLYKDEISHPENQIYDKTDLYIEKKEEIITLYSFYRNEPESFYEMIFGKILEAMEKYESILKMDMASVFKEKRERKEFESSIYQAFQKCKELAARFGYMFTGQEPELKHQQQISRFNVK